MILIKLTIDRPPDIGINKWKQCAKKGFDAIGRKWQKDMLPDHFTRAAPAKYGHQARKAKYLKNKQRGGKRKVNGRVVQIKYGGQIDNVFSGEMESLLRSPAVIQAFPSRVTIKMVGPRYITMRPYKSGQPDKAAEITRVTPEQSRELGKLLGEVTEAEYKKFKAPRTIAI